MLKTRLAIRDQPCGLLYKVGHGSTHGVNPLHFSFFVFLFSGAIIRTNHLVVVFRGDSSLLMDPDMVQVKPDPDASSSSSPSSSFVFPENGQGEFNMFKGVVR